MSSSPTGQMKKGPPDRERAHRGRIERVPHCGGINPYTLTARLGPGDLVHYEIARSLIQLPEVSCKETRRGDQAGF